MKWLLYLIGYPILRESNAGKALIVGEIFALIALATNYGYWMLCVFPQMDYGILLTVGVITLTILSLGAVIAILVLHLAIALLFVLVYGLVQAFTANFTYNHRNP